MKSLPVKLAFVHRAITWPGVAGSETSINPTRIPGLKMAITENCDLILQSKNQVAMVPSANVANYVLDCESIEEALEVIEDQ